MSQGFSYVVLMIYSVLKGKKIIIKPHGILMALKGIFYL